MGLPWQAQTLGLYSRERREETQNESEKERQKVRDNMREKKIRQWGTGGGVVEREKEEGLSGRERKRTVTWCPKSLEKDVGKRQRDRKAKRIGEKREIINGNLWWEKYVYIWLYNSSEMYRKEKEREMEILWAVWDFISPLRFLSFDLFSVVISMCYFTKHDTDEKKTDKKIASLWKTWMCLFKESLDWL